VDHRRPADLAPPPECAQLGACAGTTFEVSPRAQGVSCLDHFCSTLMLSGARFRVRLVLRDAYPSAPRYVPLAQILPACEVPCEPDELRCAALHTCWAESMDYCRFCLAAPQEECACQGKLEGEACRVFRTNDLTCSGTCQDERCVVEVGQPNCPSL